MGTNLLFLPPIIKNKLVYYRQIRNTLLVFIATLPLLVQGQINYGSNNGKFLNIRGTKVYYEEYGKGIPLLMLHGGFGDISDFQKVIPKLSEKYRVIIPDAPGLGRSEYADSILSYQLLADYNSIFIDQLKLDSVYVVGWSDGANTALILAKSRPDKVKKVIVSGANYKLDGFTKEALEECKKLTDTTWVKTELQGWIKHYQKLSTKNWKRYISEVRQMWFKEQYFPKTDLEKIKASTLVVYGDKDMYTLEHGIEIRNAIQNSQFCVIPDCSHEVFFEKPELFIELALTFLSEKVK
jgi:pimeloyl-ACP methyl ester carboxylesterase